MIRFPTIPTRALPRPAARAADRLRAASAAPHERPRAVPGRPAEGAP